MKALFSYGFRPFFLLAGLYAAFAMLAWLGWLTVAPGAAPAPGMPAALWHGHEMLFGFVAAVIAGFFLTALPNWTGGAALSGAPLAALAGLWLAGRIGLWLGAWLPAGLVAAVDLAFLPALAAVATVTLLRAGKPRNLVVVAILLLLVAGNVMVHLEILGLAAASGQPGLRLAADAVILLIVLIGGRIVPAFTAAALGRAIEPAPRLDAAAVLSVLAVLIANLVLPESTLAGAVAALAAILNGARLLRWHGLQTRGQPMLWILHLGYLWLVAGLALVALAGLTDLVTPAAGLHALTAGAAGSMTLGVMSRAALGHTGRELVAPPGIALAYGLVSAAALARILAPMLAPAHVDMAMIAAGVMWSGAFALFSWVYAPILLRPRVDGRAG